MNIFDKKFAFIPINGRLHWSLCVVVNAGVLVKKLLWDEEQHEETEAPFILFLDSLDSHRCDRIASNVRKFLNGEYGRIYGNDKNIFTKETLQVIRPQGM